MRLTIAVGVVAASLLGAAGGVSHAVDGKEVYAQKCETCHSIHGVGGKMAKLGGPLDDVGSTRDAAWLKAYFQDPKSKLPDAKMPKLKLTDEEWDAVTQYMLSLKGGAK